MTSKKFAVGIALALISILLLLGASFLYQSGERTNFGRVTTTHETAHDGELAATTSVRYDWPLHPKHRMEFSQTYEEDGSVVVEAFSVVDHGFEGGHTLIFIVSLKGDVVPLYLPGNEAEVKNILDEERYKFRLPIPS